MNAIRTEKSTVMASFSKHSFPLDFTAQRHLSYSKREKWLTWQLCERCSTVIVFHYKLIMSLNYQRQQTPCISTQDLKRQALKLNFVTAPGTYYRIIIHLGMPNKNCYSKKNSKFLYQPDLLTRIDQPEN